MTVRKAPSSEQPPTEDEVLAALERDEQKRRGRASQRKVEALVEKHHRLVEALRKL